MELCDAEAGTILLREGQEGGLTFRAARGPGAAALTGIALPAGVGVAGWVLSQGQAQLVHDPVSDPRHDLFLAEKLGVPARSLVAVPLGASSPSDAPLGVLELLNKKSGRFDEGDLRLLTLIAAHARNAIVRAEDRQERLRSDRLAAIGQMMSGVLHDLKTPMTVISGFAQLMAQSDDAEGRVRHAELIVKQCELMAAMGREVLQFARGETQLLYRRVYMANFVDEVRRQLEPELEPRKVRLEMETRYSGTATFDELKLFRLVHNLARNAAQAMEGGGTFRMTVDADDRELTFTFADTGHGIPASMQGRLFQAFATADKPDGTGLGLAIVKKIVEEHQGRISCQTEAGVGTTFRVVLPLKPPPGAMS
jgi:signal transduction histidine kinase